MTDKNIPIVGRLVSMKDLFTTIIDRKDWNKTEQQDNSEALLLMFGSLIEQGRDGPYNFCQYQNSVWVTCPTCNIPLIDQTSYALPSGGPGSGGPGSWGPGSGGPGTGGLETGGPGTGGLGSGGQGVGDRGLEDQGLEDQGLEDQGLED